MGQPGEIKKAVPSEVHQSAHIRQNRFKELIETPISVEFQKKNENQKKWMGSIQKAEKASREVEKRQIGTYELLLGIRSVKRTESPQLLSEEQRNIIRTAILESGQNDGEQRAIRESFMGSLKDQEVFVAQHDKWKSEWEKDKNPKKSEFNEFARLKGLEFIKEYAKQTRIQRADAFFDENRDKAGLSEQQIQLDKEKFFKALDLYFQANGVAMAELNSLDEKEKGVQRKLLMEKFVQVMRANGFEKTDKAKLDLIFDSFVSDFEYEYATYEEYGATYDELVDMAGLNLTPEEWNERRQKALKKNAKGELHEYLQQQPASVYSGNYEATAPVYGSIKEVENACGVHFEPSGKPNEYTIKAPAVVDNTFAPRLSVIFDPPDSKDMKNVRFVFEQRWQDEEGPGKGKPIGGAEGRPTKVYRPEDMVKAVNVALFDHVLNSKISISLPENAKQGTNRLIPDEKMVRFAERILSPFRVGDRPVREDELKVFQRFMEVILRDDKSADYNALQKRVEKLDRIISQDAMLPYLQGIFSKDGGKVKTLGGLVDELALMIGDKPKSGDPKVDGVNVNSGTNEGKAPKTEKKDSPVNEVNPTGSISGVNPGL